MGRHPKSAATLGSVAGTCSKRQPLPPTAGQKPMAMGEIRSATGQASPGTVTIYIPRSLINTYGSRSCLSWSCITIITITTTTKQQHHTRKTLLSSLSTLTTSSNTPQAPNPITKMRVTAATLAMMATTLVAAQQYDIAEGVDGLSNINMRDMVKLTLDKRSDGEEPVSLWVHKSFKVRSEDDDAAFPQLDVRADDKDKKPSNATAAAAKDKKPKKKTFKVHVTEFNDSIVKWVPKAKDVKKDPKPANKKEGDKKDKKPKTDEEKKASREKAKEKAKVKFERGSCGASSFTNKTTVAAPFTGGCLAIRNWAKKNPGKWVFSPAKVQGEINLIVAGSNSGANCRFVIRNSSGHKTFIANIDVQELITDSHRRFAVRYGNSADKTRGHRVSAEGNMKCDKQYKNGTKFEQNVSWGILKFDGQV
ncbi:hypothetical protein RB597_008930 [Gaeumannomyces tritici]